ncbi:MAG TPA: hypothetical protein VE397_16220 [Stellaceae bacterium]|nr:hypothetical protein [Stellaceae bacterium]
MRQALDPMSLNTCRRLALGVVLVLLWSNALSPQAIWLGIAMLSGGYAMIATGFAILCRDPLDPASTAGTKRPRWPACISWRAR